jgi:Repeat of unknown function (DUF346)
MSRKMGLRRRTTTGLGIAVCCALLLLSGSPAMALESGDDYYSGSGVGAWQYVASSVPPPATPDFGPAIDDYAAYDPQSTCLSQAQPGILALRSILDGAYGQHTAYILRACSDGGTSEHKEGRALDYMLSVNNANDLAVAHSIINWLLATDRFGNQHAIARRLGIMYIIWNREIWSASRHSEGWRPYSGSSPHTDHIHFSQSWRGARKQTTWWTSALPATTASSGRSYHGDDQHHVYARGANDTLQHFWYPASNPAWNRATLTGSLTAEPAAYFAGGQHHVYGRNASGALQHWWYDDAWHSANLGGSIAGSPAAYYAAGQHHVYVRSSAGTLWHFWYDGSWHSAGLGGSITDNPTAYYAGGQHHVYVRSSAGTLWHFWYTDSWHSAGLGGSIAGSPAAYYAGGQHHVYVRSSAGTLWHFWYTDSWHSAGLGGSITGSPTAYYADGQHHAYARGTTATLWHWWYTDAWNSANIGGTL